MLVKCQRDQLRQGEELAPWGGVGGSAPHSDRGEREGVPADMERRGGAWGSPRRGAVRRTEGGGVQRSFGCPSPEVGVGGRGARAPGGAVALSTTDGNRA
nr:hypothetical protein GCM10020241_21430 [Streptoalloteichus tenebrarius]